MKTITSRRLVFRTVPRLTSFASVVLAGASLIACAQTLPTAPAQASANPPPAPNSQVLLADLRQAVGTAACDADSQCHSLGLGAKPCGGPEGWIAWSSKTADGKRLEALAERQREARRAENAASGRLSNCMISIDPGAQCRAQADGLKVCQLGQPGRQNDS